MSWGPEHWSAFANVAMAAAAIAGAIAAFSGLNAWKKQTIWISDRELSRSLLKAVVHLESKIEKARQPVFWAGETSLFAEDGDANRDFQSVSEERIQRAHYARLNAIHAVYEEIEALLIEGEAAWGSDLKAEWKKVVPLLSKLFAETRLYLDWDANRSSVKDTGYFTNAVRKKENYEVVFVDPTGGTENVFSNELAAAILTLKNWLGEKTGKPK